MTSGPNEYEHLLQGTEARTAAEADHEHLRQRGGIFVEAVRVTRMPMMVTNPTLPGNPITFANPAFLELSGYSMDELLGQGPHFMNGPETDPAAIAEYEAALQSGQDSTLEILQYRKDGTPFHAMLFATVLHDGEGKAVNHFLSYLDVSRRREAEEKLRQLAVELEERVAARTRELEQANASLRELGKERELLLVEVNHRAKNSLAVAAALLVLQGNRQADPATKRLLTESADRLTAMAHVHDLLSRSETSQRVDLATYIAELCEALKPLAAGAPIAVRAKTEEDVLVDADVAFPIGIILTELITNAVKYAFPEGRSGTVLVQARRAGPGQVEVTVRDNGVGMSNFREGSLGYGLIRALVKQIGGRIAVQGDAGVTVTVCFSDASRSPASIGMES